MAGDREERIRQRAYALWEKDGGAHGRHDNHWAQATLEIDGEAAPKTKRVSRAVTAKPAAAKSAPAAKTPAPAKAPAAAKTAPAVKAPAPAKAKPAKPAAAAPKPAAKAGGRGKSKAG